MIKCLTEFVDLIQYKWRSSFDSWEDGTLKLIEN